MSAGTIRVATQTDLPELSRLWHEKTVLAQQFDRRFTLVSQARSGWAIAAARWLSDPDCQICVAERNDRLLAYIIGWIKDAPPGLMPLKLGYVTDLSVDAHSHQGGLGRVLLEALRRWFSERDIQNIIAYVPCHQPVDQAFWRAQGAVEWVDLMWLK